MDHNAYILKLKEELATPGFLLPEKVALIRAEYVSALKAKSAEMKMGHPATHSTELHSSKQGSNEQELPD